MNPSTVTDKNGNQVDEYRFETGSLFQFDKEANAYVHVWKNARDSTEAKAIKAYEKEQHLNPL